MSRGEKGKRDQRRVEKEAKYEAWREADRPKLDRLGKLLKEQPYEEWLRCTYCEEEFSGVLAAHTCLSCEQVACRECVEHEEKCPGGMDH